MVVSKTNKNCFHLFSKDKKSVLFWSQQEIEWVVLWEALIRSPRGSFISQLKHPDWFNPGLPTFNDTNYQSVK
jgi:hypothetical protein